MHQRATSVRMKMAPSDTASEAFIGSPPIELVARHWNCGAARSTKTSAFLFATYSRSPARTGDEYEPFRAPVPVSRSSQIVLPVFKSRHAATPHRIPGTCDLEK